MGERTRQAIMACATWLSYCISIGWSKSRLDNLEALWWKHHDEKGTLKEEGHGREKVFIAGSNRNKGIRLWAYGYVVEIDNFQT